MKVGSGDWESELWSLIDLGDGTNCPLYESCQHRRTGKGCISRGSSYARMMHKFLDSDSLVLPPANTRFPKTPACVTISRILELVRKLAQRYTDRMGVQGLPIPTDVIKNFNFDKPVEVRLIPLKSAHGAVWRLRDGWVIHLNSKDSSARRRFTLFHELFHILAHCNATPVFKKSPAQKEGAFNELLADHFSAVMIMPEEKVRTMWPEVRDIGKMSKIFDVPEPVMYCGLQHLRLI
jgi:hypothetical protein